MPSLPNPNPNIKFKKWQFHHTVQEKTQRHYSNPTVEAHKKAQRKLQLRFEARLLDNENEIKKSNRFLNNLTCRKYTY